MDKERRRASEAQARQAFFLALVLVVSHAQASMEKTEIRDLGQTPEQVAIFLGLRLADNHFEDIKTTTVTVLDAAYQLSKDESIMADIAEIKEKAGQPGSWQYSYEPHVTSWFVGGTLPTDYTNLTLYKNYKEGLEEPVLIPAVAYLPGNIIAGIAFVDLTRVLMFNKFPHTTWLNKGMSAVYSNNLIEGLAENEAFKADYADQFRNAKEAAAYQVKIDNKQYTAYVVKLQKPWEMLGYTTKFFLA